MTQDDPNLRTLIAALPPASRELLPLFAAVVHLPGKARWKVYVRAADETDVRATLEHRGHVVVEVQRVDRVEPTPRVARLQCLVCGYNLNLLPAQERGEVICPECGVINPAVGHNSGVLTPSIARTSRRGIMIACTFAGVCVLYTIAKLTGIL